MKTIPPVMNLKPAASRTGVICTALLAATAFSAYAQNTGFGTTKPASKVSIKGNLAVGDATYTDSPIVGPVGGPAPAGWAVIQGRVGIGTNAPVFPLHVVSKVDAGLAYVNAIGGYNYAWNGVATTPGDGDYHDLEDISIWSAGSIATENYMYANYFQAQYLFVVASDSRLKEVMGVSNSSKDLDTLNAIPVTDYVMKDKRAMAGNRAYKKVIAQDVEKVFPQAVSKTVGAIPDVMVLGEASAAEGDSLKITLAKETDLKPGERVEFRNQQNTPETAVIQAVDKNVLTVSLKQVKAGEKVFAYGRQVKDLRTVDYDAIAMLNVSATQQLAKEVEALKAENAELKKVALEMKELKALVAALEGKANGTVTVSLGK